MAEDAQDLISLTAEIVSSHVSNNVVATPEIASLISDVHAALAKVSRPAPPQPEAPKGAVSVRASIKPDHLVSMIDGKPYKMLRRHIQRHGYTPETYRETFGLPRDYPLVAAKVAEQRRAVAARIGLGRKGGRRKGAPSATNASVDAAAPAKRRGRPPKAKV